MGIKIVGWLLLIFTALSFAAEIWPTFLAGAVLLLVWLAVVLKPSAD